MTIEDVIKKSILPLAFMVFWFWMTKTIMKVSGQTDWFWWVFIAGLPFGIHKMRLILIPRGMDTTATLLYIVLKEYTTDRGNLHPNEISNLEMGYIFEEIIRRFSESHNEDAGQHYTPREVIQLMVNILFYDDNDILSGNNVAKTIYDPACGTGGMLSVAEEYLHSLNASTELVSFGQEINDQTFAICKADMLIKGNNADYIKDGNTLSDDQFAGSTFDYICRRAGKNKRHWICA